MHLPPIGGRSVCFSLHPSQLASSPPQRSPPPTYKYRFQVCTLMSFAFGSISLSSFLSFSFARSLSLRSRICSSVAMSAVEEVPKLAKEKKPRAPKVPKEKKAKVSKPSSLSHPPYFQMIKDALLALNEKTGSSPYAIAKFMEEKHKGVLPANYKKMLAIQLKNFAAKGKLVKVKASFKLSEAGKKEGKPAKKEKRPAKAQKPKEASSGATKRKAPSTVPAAKRKKPAVSSKASKSPKKAAGAKKAKKVAPAKPKQPKSIKSPAAKKARKTVA